jgi:hypothetical protein
MTSYKTPNWITQGYLAAIEKVVAAIEEAEAEIALEQELERKIAAVQGDGNSLQVPVFAEVLSICGCEGPDKETIQPLEEESAVTASEIVEDDQ